MVDKAKAPANPASVVAATGKTVAMPYKDMASAVKDKFKKLGGEERAFSFLTKGFKAAAWRKRTDAAAKAREAAEADEDGV